jgi:hypothetical protein
MSTLQIGPSQHSKNTSLLLLPLLIHFALSSYGMNFFHSNTIFSSVFDYYARILTASCPFIDQEVLPISICQAFIDGLDPRLLMGFCTHFPDYRKSQECTATHQHKVLQEMLQAAICAETDYNNIRTIANKAMGMGQAFSTQGQAFCTQANVSQVEMTITQYSGGTKVPPNLVARPAAAHFAGQDAGDLTLG